MFEGLYNSIMQLIFIVTALVSVKSLTDMITQLVGQGDALKDGKETGQEVLKRVGQTAAIGAVGAGAALKIGQAGLGVARSVGGTIARSDTVGAIKQGVGSSIHSLRNKASEWYTGTEFGHNRQEKKATEGFAAMFGDPDAQVNRSRWENFKGNHQKLTNAGNKFSRGAHWVADPLVSGVSETFKGAADEARGIGKWASGGLKNIKADLANNPELQGFGGVDGSIKQAKDSIQNLFGGVVKTTGVHKQIEDLVGADAMPFEKGASKYYRAITGEKVGSEKKADEKKKAAEAQVAQADAVQKAMQNDLSQMTDAIVKAIKNINMQGATVTFSDVAIDEKGNPVFPGTGEVGAAKTSAVTENKEGKTEVQGKVDINSEQIVNAINSLKESINTTDANIGARLTALAAGMAIIGNKIETGTREITGAVDKTEKATKDVGDKLKGKQTTLDDFTK